MKYPEVRKTPCFDCPWVRTSTRGWLGPFTVEEWVAIVRSDEAIACHMTIEESGNWQQPGMLQCAGAAIYRSNIFKSPRDPEVATLPANMELVFGFYEFEEHHTL